MQWSACLHVSRYTSIVSTYVSMSACTLVIYVYIYLCIYTHARTYLRIYVCMYVCMHVHITSMMYVCECMCVYIFFVYACMDAWINGFTDGRMDGWVDRMD